MRERINNRIRARELRVIDDKGNNLGVLHTEEALKIAIEKDLDLVEVSPKARPPVAKIVDYGKYKYEANKKAKKAKSGAASTETKSIQVKINTGDHDLNLKAKKASKWLKEGHRIRVELYLVGRAKYMDRNFLKGRLDRVLHLITEDYKISEPCKKQHKGLVMTIEKAK